MGRRDRSGDRPLRPHRAPIPYRFRVRGRRWKLWWGTNSRRKHPDWNPRTMLAWCDNKRRIIILHPNLRLDIEGAWETFTHELVHAMSNFIRHDHVHKIEVPLAAFLRDNVAEWHSHRKKKTKKKS
jgi:hypothetical protein